MNIIQRVRASHLNRHGFVDALVGVTLFQIVYTTLLMTLSELRNMPDDPGHISVPGIVLTGLFVAPYVENLLLIGIAAIHEKLFKRRGLFVFAPLVLTLLHFYAPREFTAPFVLRFLTLYFFFYVFLKQYDLHKVEIGKHKALLLTSVIHFSLNVSAMIVVSAIELYIAAETIFSASPGE